MVAALSAASRFEFMPGQQRNLTGDRPGGVRPGKYGHAETLREREQLAQPIPVACEPARRAASDAVSGTPSTAHSVGVQAAPVCAINRNAWTHPARCRARWNPRPHCTSDETRSVVTWAATRPPAACTAVTIAWMASPGVRRLRPGPTGIPSMTGGKSAMTLTQRVATCQLAKRQLCQPPLWCLFGQQGREVPPCRGEESPGRLHARRPLGRGPVAAPTLPASRLHAPGTHRSPPTQEKRAPASELRSGQPATPACRGPQRDEHGHPPGQETTYRPGSCSAPGTGSLVKAPRRVDPQINRTVTVRQGHSLHKPWHLTSIHPRNSPDRPMPS